MAASSLAFAVIATGMALSIAACSSSSSNTTSPTTTAVPSATGSAPSTRVGSGSVNVFYAGSLSTLMTKVIGPDFQSQTGYTFQGTGGDAGMLANEIKAKTVRADIFISAAPSKDQVLEGPANGNWVSWYASFATSPLVLGYNPRSSFASDFTSQPWYEAVDHPGVLLGRTDPAIDPKGVLAVKALDAAAAAHHEPQLATDATDTSEIFPETSLVSRLQSGNLDAGFLYSVEATSANIKFVPVTGAGTLQAQYTITIVNHGPDPAAAAAFVGYLLGSDGQQQMAHAGIDLTKPVAVSGTAPSGLQGLLSSG
jgi:molybdate/tungstate transport system substrate-binding protein